MRTTRQKHKARAKAQEKRGAKRAAKRLLVKPASVQISFANEAAASHFAHWLCGSGEQHYWDWMQAREDEEDGPITALHFDYHTLNGGKFGTKVATECGRLSPNEGKDR